MVGTFLVVGALVGADLEAGRFALAGVAAWLLGCVIAAVASLLGVLSLNRGLAGGVTAGT